MGITEALNGGQLPGDFAEHVDVASGLKRVASNQNIYVKILKSFLASGEPAKLKEQTDSGDIAAAADTAHGIKGMSGNLSLTKLYEATVALEGQLKQGSFEPGTRDLFFASLERTNECLRLLLAAAEQ
ncbi:MAG: Hpt domain-containing protein [Clostridiales Family XIII bacterium]|jgi:HPt (histidine-containing phosphotransfer) domain-containing protein|nr:Hpt domain-containing protein [Clostridiales Family XIII bacterium]